ncbi:hypothetical protein LBMAG52_09120 [Planctomycetia bacterium]|nr:hypothetical protein LBMAG52_09120 [Planctomycetia bacterium]
MAYEVRNAFQLPDFANLRLLKSDASVFRQIDSLAVWPQRIQRKIDLAMTKRFLLILALAVLGLMAHQVTHASDVPSVATSPQLLKDFRRVVIADGASKVQRAAADELASYAGRVVGTKLDVIPFGKLAADAPGLSFFVGDDVAERVLGQSPKPWKTEEWMLRTVPNGLVLAGHDGDADPWSIGTAAGSMLAVYTLLEDHLGVRWFWPGEFGEHVPSRADATLPVLKERRQPAFEIRSIQLGYPSTYHTKTFTEASRKWMRRARLGWVKSAIFGHSWGSAFDLRTDVTFREHPEWFALVNGKRRPPQMCTTHPEVIARMVDYVLKGKQDIMNISPSDGGGFCECERCRALDVPGVLAYDKKTPQLSDRMFTYANEVARRVREQNPEKGCGMFAYTYYHKPPLKIKTLEPNLYLSFAFQCAAHRDPENLREWRESVSGWQKLGAKMVIREGWGSHYFHDLPWIHHRQITANLAEGHRLGFVAAYGEGSKSFATQAPNSWAITHMMWDPNRDASKLMRDFYDSAYGPVAKEMEAYFETYNQALDVNWPKRDRVVDATGLAYANLIASWGKLIPPSAVEEAEKHLQAAEAKVPAGEYADRVKFHRFGHDYTKVLLELLANYKELSELGVKMEFASAIKPNRNDPAARDALLKRTYELGEQREQMLLAHRDWAGPDEGLYAFTNDIQTRQWHTAVKAALGIDKPTALTKQTLGKQ